MENGKAVKPGYYSVIPAEVRYCEALGKPTARDLYGEIAALCNKHGYCFATNQYLADLYGIEARTIRRYLALLEKHGFIYVKAGVQRKIYLAHASKFDPKGLRQPEVEPSTDGQVEPAPDQKEPKVDAPKKEKAAKATAIDLQLAETLLSKILLNFPTFENKKVKIADWAEEIRKLREIDKATVQQIEFMITWVQGGTAGKRTLEPHDFWCKNILSATKLRKQWFTLVPQLQQALKKDVKKNVAADLRSPAQRTPAGAHRAAKL